jgi:3-deoxy-D-manno-octulosonate 8-phosphate phosphatase (KDO 8-P phosphatase)
MNLLELFAPIRTFIFDVDGVLTDGNFHITNEGLQLRTLHARDEYALQQAVKKGYKVWLHTTERTEAMRLYVDQLGLREVHLEDIKAATQTAHNTILYMGDDIPDLTAMQLCGLPCCPNDAVSEVRQYVKYISPQTGGHGCVRDVIEKVLKLNGDWDLLV